MYTQNKEEQFITNYFNGMNKKGTLLSIGENDGKTFSNSLRLIELGWQAVLVEPAPEAFGKMEKLHAGNPNVKCLQVAICDQNGTHEFWESGTHLKKGDSALLSTLKKEELKRWECTDNEFHPIEVKTMTYNSMLSEVYPGIIPPDFDFISIDAEGVDIIILKQIDLSNTEMLCIEWNGDEEVKKEIMEYCEPFGLKYIQYQSGENLIIVKYLMPGY